MKALSRKIGIAGISIIVVLAGALIGMVVGDFLATTFMYVLANATR